MRHDETDVVVVGAGPAGSSTALRLARLGHRVTLIDRARFPREKVCSEYMSPETVRHLDALGVLSELGRGIPIDGTTVLAPRGNSLTGIFARAGGTPFRSTGLAMPRSVLDAVLVRAAVDAGVQVHEDVTAVDIARANGATIAHTRTTDGTLREFRARVVVGADGLRSVIARRAGLHRQGYLRRVAFSAHLSGMPEHGTRATLDVARHGYVGINPIGDNLTNVTLVVPQHRASQARGDASGFFFDELAKFPRIAQRIAGCQVARSVMVTGPFDAMSRRSVQDGLLLVGDAADFFDPFTGEGICTALAGGAFAASTINDALARPGPVSAARLAHYRTLRRQEFLGKWIIERMIGYAMLAPALFDRAVGRLERRGMADTLIGVTGHFVSPWRILNPVAMAKMIV